MSTALYCTVLHCAATLQYRYVFPGVGLAAIIAGATCITEDDFFVAAQNLASQVMSKVSNSSLLFFFMMLIIIDLKTDD